MTQPAGAAAPAAGIAIAAMLSSTVGFALSDLFAKRLAAGGAGTPELVGLRLLCLGLWLGWLLLRGARLRRSRHAGLQLLRGLGITGSSLVFVLGLSFLPLAAATAIGFSSPIYITLLSAWLLRERVQPARWAWVVVGFAGVVAVAGPSPATFDVAALLPLTSALLWSAAMICTRLIGNDDDAFTTQIWTCAVGLACVGLVLAAAAPGTPRPAAAWSASQWIEGLAMGLAWSFAQWQVARAYARAQASALAPLAYIQMLWAGFLAWGVLGQPPTLRTMVGSALIALAGLGMLRTR
ncbi:MAG: DMT family transporter [Comamonadaceae bacterium]|nr:DMT family transporter [Rubrivivax sp.]NLZ41265.1 DMT family transporter [Comamonadaceae bacterium]